jgi:hypothetical protein
MSFDDYSYKFYNGAVLNPKAIKEINDDENQSLIAAANEQKQGAAGHAHGDEDSQLTQDNLKEFEHSIHYDEDGLHDFIPKDKN